MRDAATWLAAPWPASSWPASSWAGVVSWLGVAVAAAITEIALATRHPADPSPVGALTDRIMQALTVVVLLGPVILAAMAGGAADGVTVGVGAVLGLAGCALRVTAMVALGRRYQLTPGPHGDALELRSTGIYGVIRHPGYLGLLLVFSGLALIAGGTPGLVFAVPLLLGVLLRIQVEESILLAEFGDDYRRYARSVRWKLIPLVL